MKNENKAKNNPYNDKFIDSTSENDLETKRQYLVTSRAFEYYFYDLIDIDTFIQISEGKMLYERVVKDVFQENTLYVKKAMRIRIFNHISDNNILKESLMETVNDIRNNPETSKKIKVVINAYFNQYKKELISDYLKKHPEKNNELIEKQKSVLKAKIATLIKEKDEITSDIIATYQTKIQEIKSISKYKIKQSILTKMKEKLKDNPEVQQEVAKLQ